MLVRFDENDGQGEREYQFDLDEITVSQARIIKRQTGMSLLKLQEALSEADPDALVALYWLMKAQNGIGIDMQKAEFPLVKFGAALADAAEREAKTEAENPTEAQAEAAQATT